MIGQKFGRLEVIAEAGQDKHTSRLYLCKCDCENDKIAAGWLLRRGEVKSCGCLRKEAGADRNRTHGARHTPAFSVWRNMRVRCDSPKSKYFSDYGGRGIKVCDRWQSFPNFLADMGQPPTGMTLERKDNALGYCKDNCEWATRVSQARNRRSNRVIEWKGQSKSLAEWAEVTGLKRATIAWRLDQGWTPDLALTTPKLK